MANYTRVYITLNRTSTEMWKAQCLSDRCRSSLEAGSVTNIALKRKVITKVERSILRHPGQSPWDEFVNWLAEVVYIIQIAGLACGNAITTVESSQWVDEWLIETSTQVTIAVCEAAVTAGGRDVKPQVLSRI